MINIAEYKLTHFPLILENSSNHFAYGGSQEWFGAFWKRQAGCAATSGANLAAFYEMLGSPETASDGKSYYLKKDFIHIMDTLYRYMTPGIMGFPNYEKYIEAFLAFAKKHNKQFNASFVKGWNNLQEPITFLKAALSKDQPVVMLILTHQAPEIRENTWHWMTITGYDDETGQITISNYSRKERHLAATIFAPHANNDVKLITFEPINT